MRKSPNQLQTFADAYSQARFTESVPVLEAPGEFEDAPTHDTRLQSQFLDKIQEEPKSNSRFDRPFNSADSGARNPARCSRTMTVALDGITTYANRTELDDDSVMTKELPRMPNQSAYVRQRTPKTMTFYLGADDALTGTFAFVEGTTFQSSVGAVIFLNSIIIGLETDYDSRAFWYIEQFLLAFFCTELCLRLCRHGCHFFKHEDDWVWNLLDFSIVCSGVFDQWGMPVFKYCTRAVTKEEDKKSSMSLVFMLMRMLRLLRIVRLFRLVRMVRPLYNLAVGVLEAMQGMFWVLVFMLMFLYAVAILCTRFIGHGAALTDDMKEDEEIQAIMLMFGNVPDSMFTLFGTVSSWSLLKFVPLFDETPILRPMFFFFYVYSAWALLAVMTGVVSENLYAIRDQLLRDEEERENQRKANISRTLNELFEEADADGSGEVSHEEFNRMLLNPKLMTLLSKNTHIRAQDLLDLFAWIDQDKSGTITVDEFMGGFNWINEPLTAKSLVKLQEKLMQMFIGLKNTIHVTVDDKTHALRGPTTQPLRKIHAISEQIDNLGEICSTLKFNLQEEAEWVPSMRQITKSEQTLHDKMDNVFQRISYLQRAGERIENFK